MNDIINSIMNKEDFLCFMEKLKEDSQLNREEWENKEIYSYLAGISSWLEDMGGYFHNMEMDMPTDIDWQFIATLFYVGKIYE